MNAHLRRRGPRPKLLTESALRELYAAGHSQAEIAEKLDTTQRTVCVRMKQLGIAARVAAKRDQRGERNHVWKGDNVAYLAAHKRVYRERGQPSHCEICGTTEPRLYEWANKTGDYANVNDYLRACIPCHRKFDKERRDAGRA